MAKAVFTEAAADSVSVCCLAAQSLCVDVSPVAEQDLNRALSAAPSRNVERCLGPWPLSFVWGCVTIQHSDQDFVTIRA
jgi:hypothetical protein